MRRPRRNHSPVFKVKVALAAIEGSETLTQLADRFDLHVHQIAQWSSQLVARAAEVFAAAEEPRGGAPPIDLKGLPAKIGQWCSRCYRAPRHDAGWRSRRWPASPPRAPHSRGTRSRCRS